MHILWRTFLPNFIPIRFEMAEPKAFLKRSPQQKEDQHQEEEKQDDQRYEVHVISLSENWM